MTRTARKLTTRSAATKRPANGTHTRRRATPAQLRARARLIAEMLEHNPMPSEAAIEAIRRSWKA